MNEEYLDIRNQPFVIIENTYTLEEFKAMCARTGIELPSEKRLRELFNHRNP